MDKVIVYSDPHIGFRRHSGTTNASQVKMQEENLKILDDILGRDGPKVCGGDLFDQFSNSETVIAQAMGRMRKTDLCIAGNHDLVQASDKIGSLKLLQDSDPELAERIIYADFGDYGFVSREVGNHWFWGVPHVARQDLFEQSLALAEKDCKEQAIDGPKILFLHANYNLPWELTETSLNLTQDRAKELLETFDYILTGHDHNAKEELDGRMIVIGNIFPTKFGEIGDKRILVFEDGVPRSETVWTAEGNYEELGADAVPEGSDAQFIRITGTVPAAELATAATLIAGLWKNCPNLLALKSEVRAEQMDTGQSDTGMLARLPDRIESELKDGGLKTLWAEMLASVA